MNYRKIYKNIFGEIPKEENGRSYEVHHKDGNRQNNNPENLLLLTIQEHYNTHLKQEDWGACLLIAKRMRLPISYIPLIQKGKKRPGIGGVKKGTVPWNKGKPHSQETKEKISKIKRGKRAFSKLSESIVEEILKIYNSKPILKTDNINKVMKNGKIMTYERAFSKEFADVYGVVPLRIYKIIRSN